MVTTVAWREESSNADTEILQQENHIKYIAFFQRQNVRELTHELGR